MARTLSLSFIQMTMLDRFINYINDRDVNLTISEKEVMKKLGIIYALWCLEKHIAHLYQYQILIGRDQVNRIHETLLKLCKDLVPNAIALVDVLAPPDFVLNSILGNSDGQIYQHLKQSFFSTPRSFERASYWNKIVKANL